MKKEEIINLFNSIIYNTPVDINNDIIPLISEYLEDIKIDSNKYIQLIQFIISNPILLSEIFPKIIPHFCRKYFIKSLISNKQTILYYD